MNKLSKKNISDKKKVISMLRARIGQPEMEGISLTGNITSQDLNALLSKLQIFQLELEMQNGELTESHRLLESERSRFAGFFNLAPVSYFILDHLGIIEEANHAALDLLGISREALIKKRFQSFVDPENLEQFYYFLHKMQTIEGRQRCELKLCPDNDCELHTQIDGCSIYNAFTKKVQHYVAVIDVSERRKSLQKLSDTSERLEMTLSASGIGTWTIEMGENKVFLDDFSFSVLNISPWEFDGSIPGFINLVHPADRGKFKEKLFHAINSFREVDLEFRTASGTGQSRTIAIKGKEVHNTVSPNYFAGILMDVTQSKKMAEESQKLESEKQRLIQTAAFSAQEKERYEISSALHDGVCQILYGIRMNLQNIQVTQGLKGEFRNVNNLLDQAIRETRELSYELTPSILRDFGFRAGVREMAERMSTPSFRISTAIHSETDELPQELQLYLFRMIQELVNNCIKHAGASSAEIRISMEEDVITLIVSDNGKGFKENQEHAIEKGSGLRAIKNRVYLLNGTMVLENSAQGTIIVITIQRYVKGITS